MALFGLFAISEMIIPGFTAFSEVQNDHGTSFFTFFPLLMSACWLYLSDCVSFCFTPSFFLAQHKNTPLSFESGMFSV
jgi:hypothetical protein